MNASMYRVYVYAYGGGLWLKVQKPAVGIGASGWDTLYLEGLSRADWRLTGGYIVPSMWFKPLEERVRIAVGYAVDAVKCDMAKDNKRANADELAAEWTVRAQAMFAEAMREADTK